MWSTVACKDIRAHLPSHASRMLLSILLFLFLHFSSPKNKNENKQRLYPVLHHSLAAISSWCSEWQIVLNYWWSWPLVPGRRGGVCFQKPKLPLTSSQNFCPTGSSSNQLICRSQCFCTTVNQRNTKHFYSATAACNTTNVSSKYHIKMLKIIYWCMSGLLNKQA